MSFASFAITSLTRIFRSRRDAGATSSPKRLPLAAHARLSQPTVRPLAIRNCFVFHNFEKYL